MTLPIPPGIAVPAEEVTETLGYPRQAWAACSAGVLLTTEEVARANLDPNLPGRKKSARSGAGVLLEHPAQPRAIDAVARQGW